MKKEYKVIISEVIRNEGEKYPDTHTLYEQTVNELDVPALVRFINQDRHEVKSSPQDEMLP